MNTNNDGPQTMREVYFLIGLCIWSAIERDGLAGGKRPNYSGLVRIGFAFWPNVKDKLQEKRGLNG